MNMTQGVRPISTGKIIGLVIVGVLIVLALWVMATYNSMVGYNENAKTAQANIEVQYQRRFDLIPNLVSAVQGIMTQEQTVFKDLADARSRYSGSTTGSPEKIAAMNQVESSLSRLLVVMENYPQLRSAEAVTSLMDQLEGTENRISQYRNDYNEVVNLLNKKVQYFPGNIVAKVFGFAQRARFEATKEAAITVPKVELNVK